MKNWIFLKHSDMGFDDINAVALATVLNADARPYHVVHTSNTGKYFKGLKNVEVGYPNAADGDEVTYVTLPDYAPFDVLCHKIASCLGVDSASFIPYIGFTRGNNEIDTQIERLGESFFFCYYSEGRDLSLIERLDNTTCALSAVGEHSVCCGTRVETLLKEAYDFRDLVQVDELVKHRHSIKAIVTSFPFVKNIALLLHIPVVFLFTDAFMVYSNDKVEVVGAGENYSQKLFDVLMDIEHPQSQCSLRTEVVKKKFEVPYNFEEELLTYYSAHARYVNFLFLPPYSDDTLNTRTCIQTRIKGRSYMPQSREEYEYHIRLILDHGLRFVVLWQDRDAVISEDLLNYYAGIGACGFIVANDDNAKIIKDYDSNLLVISSIVQRLCAGMSSRDFTYYDYIVMFYPFTRSLEGLKKLSTLKDKIVIMPNSMCHTDCPGLHHWFAEDIRSFERSNSCPAVKDESRSTFIKPEHLAIFDDLVGGYKLQGREWSADYIVSICEAYFHRTTLKHLISDGLLKTINEGLSKLGEEEYYNVKTPEIIAIV